jgi:Flp pilus assembly protein TadD
MFMTRRYSVLFASLALLSLVPGCSTTTKAPVQQAPEDAANNEPDLLQKLHERMASGAPHPVQKPKAGDTAAVAATDSSKASGVAAAAAASGVAVDPVKQQKALAVADDYAQAMTLANSGKDDEAMTLLRKISAKVPEFSGPLVNQGAILIKQQHYTDAEKVLRQAVAVNDQNVFAYNELGLALRQQGKFTDAKAAYLSALAIDPNYAKAHFNLGVLADLYLQDLLLAISHYQAYQALQAKPDKTVGNWIVDLQKRTGTYTPPPKPAPVAAAPTATSGDAAAPAASGAGTPAIQTTAPASAPPATATPVATPAAAPAHSAPGGKS